MLVSTRFQKKVRASERKLEIDDHRIPTRTKVPNHSEEEQAPAEFVSTVEEHDRQISYQKTDVVIN